MHAHAGPWRPSQPYSPPSPPAQKAGVEVVLLEAGGWVGGRAAGHAGLPLPLLCLAGGAGSRAGHTLLDAGPRPLLPPLGALAEPPAAGGPGDAGAAAALFGGLPLGADPLRVLAGQAGVRLVEVDVGGGVGEGGGLELRDPCAGGGLVEPGALEAAER